MCVVYFHLTSSDLHRTTILLSNHDPTIDHDLTINPCTDRTPAALMQQDILCMRKRARQWVLLWKALLALAQDMLACEDADEDRLAREDSNEDRRRQFLRILDRVDRRVSSRTLFVAPILSVTTFISVHPVPYARPPCPLRHSYPSPLRPS